LNNSINNWSVYLDNRDVFAGVLRSTGGWTVADGLDVIHDFVIDRLPDALKSYDPERGKIKNWLFIVFLRYAKRRKLELVSWSKRKIDLDSIPELPSQNANIDKSFFSYLQNKITSKMEGLDKEHKMALVTYFGEESESGNIRALARKFKWSRYKAEQKVLEGLAMLSAQLNENSLLSDTEQSVCRSYFSDKKPWEEIAKAIGMSEHQARMVLKASIAKFRFLLT
jgi:DNA-directed RNA polymerase specialized sigma subunit